jgi:CRISPR-associated endonuclease Cas2
MNKNRGNGGEDNQFKHGELRQIVLSSIGLGILLGGTFLVTPNFPIVFGAILNIIKELSNKKIPEKKIKRVLKNLEKKELIQIIEKDGEAYVYLKSGWTPVILKYSLKPLLALKKKKKKWDGKWFIIVFDVPEGQRNKRDYLRMFLREIGFYQYQQSVYIFPYQCKKEIELIKKIVEGAKYISYITACEIENEEQVKRYFGLPSR